MQFVTTLAKPVIYPESDGKPMGETDVHVSEIAALLEMLRVRYRDDMNVNVGANMLCYYAEGEASKCFSPDVFVVLGVPKRSRRTFKLWEELKPPTVIIEVTSRESRRDDVIKKKSLYARLHVQEYFVYDPLREYLRPPLQGFRLKGAQYTELLAEPDGSLFSTRLGLKMKLEGKMLELWDVTTGERLLRYSEEFQRRREAEHRERAAVERALEAEAEVENLRRQLARRSKKRGK